MPQDDEKDRDDSAQNARVDRVAARMDGGMKGTNMPDILKVHSSSSKGEKFAAYQGGAPQAPKASEDTQKVEDAVIVDQTQQDGISADEIQKLARERRERVSRDATTSVIEIAPLPKKSALPLVVFLAVFFVGAAALIVKMQHESGSDSPIEPASAAAVQPPHHDDPQIPPVPTSVTTATEAVTSATPRITNATPASTGATQPQTNATSSASSAHATAHAATSASAGSDDPDKALFKTQRTP